MSGLMDWQCSLETMLQRDAPLDALTTFGIGGPASVLLAPRDAASFAAAYATACTASARDGLEVYVLGGGSNLLVDDQGVPGIVIATTGLRERSLDAGEGRVRAQAGVLLSSLVRRSAEAGLSGLECLAGIPGTVGGAVWMNAGGNDGTIGDCVARVWCVNDRGEMLTVGREHIQLDYRSTDLRWPVVEVELQLRPDAPERILERVTRRIEAKRASQQMDLPSAGCFFRNPPGESAGRLIERAGMKEARVGGAIVSGRHANFIVNLRNASAADVLMLAETVRERVRAEFGIVLENEVRLWPAERRPRDAS